MDTTPRTSDEGPDRPDDAPRWFLIVGVLVIALGGLWFLWTFFNQSGY